MTNKFIKIGFCITIVLSLCIIGCSLLSNEIGKSVSLHDVLLNLSYSFIAAIIFYVLNEYLPKISHRQKAMKVLHPYLVELYLNADVLIAIEKFRCGCIKENQDLVPSDFKTMMLNNNNKIFVNGYVRIDSKYWRENSTKEWIEPITDTVNCALKMKEKTQEILSNSISKYLDENLLEILCEIQLSEFLDTVISRKMNLEVMPECCSYEESRNADEFMRLVHNVLRLNNYKFPHHEHKFVKMTEQEEREYVNYLNEAKITLRSIIEKQSEFKIYHGYYRVK